MGNQVNGSEPGLLPFPNPSPAGGNTGGVAMTNSPVPPTSSMENPASVGGHKVSSPLPSVTEIKKEPLSLKMSSPSSGYYSSVPVSEVSSQYNNSSTGSGIPSLPMDMDETPARGAGSAPNGSGLLPTKVEIKEEPPSVGHVGAAKPGMGVSSSPLPPTNNNSQPSIHPPSVPSLPDIGSAGSSHSALSSPLEGIKKEMHTATPPSIANVEALSQESQGPQSAFVPKTSPKEEGTKKIDPATKPSLHKGMMGTLLLCLLWLMY